MKKARFVIAALTALGLTAAGVAASTAAVAATPQPYLCSGDMPSGTYAGLTVAGSCEMSGVTVHVKGDVTIRSGGYLEVVGSGSTLTVAGNLIILPNADFVSGQSATTVRVRGNVTVGVNGLLDADDYSPTQMRIDGDLSLSAGAAVDMTGDTGAPESVGGSVYLAQILYVILEKVSIGGNVIASAGGSTYASYLNYYFASNTIAGDVRITGVRATTLQFIGNRVHGSVYLIGNASAQSTVVAANHITNNLICSANTPAPEYGEWASPPPPQNHVGGVALDQCAALTQPPI